MRSVVHCGVWFLSIVGVAFTLTSPVLQAEESGNSEEPWTFVSMPDFLNVDTI